MWTLQHTALLTRVHSTPSLNTSELCNTVIIIIIIIIVVVVVVVVVG